MKYSEFHRKILAAGWKFSHAEGSHYFYTKNGKLSEPVPYHGAKEVSRTAKKKNCKGYGDLIPTPFYIIISNSIVVSWRK